MFKLNRLSAEGGIAMDEAGWHHLVYARRHTDTTSADYDNAALRANEVGYALADPRLIEDWGEWDDGITNSIVTTSAKPAFACGKAICSGRRG
jgi:hypothetical protein